NFWLRRSFRIAPLYYLLLAAALIAGPSIGEMRDAIAQLWPHTATSPNRYRDQSLANILAHVTFSFGVLPRYYFATPLPDWSIILEMQFYLLFPFLMLMVARIGGPVAGAMALLGCAVVEVIFRGYVHQFEMPSFLPLKLYVFFIGMWIA